MLSAIPTLGQSFMAIHQPGCLPDENLYGLAGGGWANDPENRYLYRPGWHDNSGLPSRQKEKGSGQHRKTFMRLLEHSGVLKNDSLIHELGACWECAGAIDKGTCEILLTSKGDSDG